MGRVRGRDPIARIARRLSQAPPVQPPVGVRPAPKMVTQTAPVVFIPPEKVSTARTRVNYPKHGFGQQWPR